MSSTDRNPKQLLADHGLRPKRHFGQNFLLDANLARQIAELSTSPPGGSVVEIGAGLGALTRPLLQRAARVFAIERDRDLLPVLRAEFAESIAAGRLELLEADAKAVDAAELLMGCPPPHVLAGNLPYQITGPLLERAASLARRLHRLVFLVQLEVAQRITASPGSKDYGAPSVFLQVQFRCRRELLIRRGAFYPQPRVDSAVVVLSPLAEPMTEETELFRQLVRAAFGQRRKKLANAWQSLPGVHPPQLKQAADQAEVDLDARGESLPPAAFARMAGALSTVLGE